MSFEEDRKRAWQVLKSLETRMSDRVVGTLIRYSGSNSPMTIIGLVMVWIAAVMIVFMVQASIFAHEGEHSQEYMSEHAVAAFLTALPFALITMFVFRRLAQLQSNLANLAATDTLTGLANRRTFFERAEAEHHRRGGVIMVLDVDHFKRVNDRYGHAVGDQCLQALADLLRQETRATDVVGRLGGEEFAVYLVEAPIDKAREIGERFAKGVQFSVANECDDLRLTASVGAVAASGEAQLDDLVLRADTMMYAAKRAGRGRLLVWERTVLIPDRGSAA